VGEISFWYRPTRVVPDQRPLNGRCCCCCIPPTSSGVRRGEAVISWPVVWGPMAVVLPRSRSPVPSPAVLGVLLPTMLIVRRRRWGPVIGRERRRVRLVIASPPLRAPTGDPTPITQVKVRTRAKSTTGFSLSKPVPGFKTGSRLTSLTLISLTHNLSQLLIPH